MKYLSELRADHRAATHRELHCRRSVFQGALYATSPWAVLVLRLLSTRPMQFSIVRSILHGFSEFSKLSVAGSTRQLNFRFKVEMHNKLVAENHAGLGHLPVEVLEVTN